jgi:hypothetical protein
LGSSNSRTFTKDDIFCIQIATKEFTDKSSDAAKLCFLKRLFSLDYRCRDISNFKTTTVPLTTEVRKFTSWAERKASKSSSLNSEHKNNNDLSNSDIVLSALLSCDDFLIQDAFEAMASCQLAVPMITTFDGKSVFHLWASRTIRKKWRSLHDDMVANNDMFISSKQMGCISFCRIGKTSVSKSKLANAFFSCQGGSDHPYFMNRDTDSESKLNQGSIEACWYCPEKRTGEKLKDINIVYNLRGDAREHQREFELLLRISSVIVILHEDTELNEAEENLLSKFKTFSLVFDLSTENEPEKLDNVFFIGCKNKNIKLISETLLQNLPDNFETKMSLEGHTDEAKKVGIEIDEENEVCKEGKEAAEEFIDMIKKHEKTVLKKNVLPLQGTFWQKWAKQDKEETRKRGVGETSHSEYSAKISAEKIKLRKEQLENGLSEEIKLFRDNILKFKNLNFFLLWCQMGLNTLSELYLPQILQDYNSSKRKLSELSIEIHSPKSTESYFSETEKKIKDEEEVMARISKEFEDASFGMEHIFRELGQVYECYNANNKSKEAITLPKKMAEIFLMGYPLEIMDGNTSHIPTDWIKQVFSELKKKLGGHTKIYVLSILGIQSSGKSTLLNTMFGSKFAVSSGRCTKGVYLQLLKVAEELKEKLNCDYFVIMDSEGLRSPEHIGSFQHDNEIATLVACLANTTLINFFGQTLSKEMTDILQIAAHAYIRMTNVEIKSSFHMVYVGVTDVNAEDRNQLGVDKVLGELNSIVYKIAQSEGCLDKINGLSSIFPLIKEKLNDIDIPQFLPTLWQGATSPPDSLYGEIALKLRDALCQGLMQQQHQIIRSQTLNEFVNRLKDIWEAIKQENFVFGFRNSNAIECYADMQQQYDKEVSNIRNQFFDKSYILTEYSIKEAMNIKSEPSDIYNRYILNTNKTLQPLLEDLNENAIEKLRFFVQSLPDPDLAFPHLPTFKLDLNAKIYSWLLSEQLSTRQKIFSICQLEKTAPKALKEYEKNLLEEARKVASKLKGQKSFLKHDIKKAFKNMFLNWLKEAQEKDSEVIGIRSNLFDKIFERTSDILVSKLKLLQLKKWGEVYKTIEREKQSVKDDLSNDIEPWSSDLKKTKRKKDAENFVFQLSRALSIKSDILTEMKDHLEEEKKKEIHNFNDTAALGRIVDSTYLSITKDTAEDFAFQTDYIKNVLIKVYMISVKKLALMQEENLKKCSLANYLVTHKEELSEEFKKECEAANSDSRAAERFVRNVLREIFVEQVKLDAGKRIEAHAKSLKEFNKKSDMMYYVYKELLELDSDEIVKFSKNYEECVKQWIERKVVGLCEKNKRFTRIIKDRINQDVQSAIESLRNVADKVSKKDTSHEEWWTFLDKSLKTKGFKYSVS